jgi:hypothetical protein
MPNKNPPSDEVPSSLGQPNRKHTTMLWIYFVESVFQSSSFLLDMLRTTVQLMSLNEVTTTQCASERV